LAKQSGEVEGWVRLRFIKVLESGKTKMGAAVSLDEGEVGRYFVVRGMLALSVSLCWEADCDDISQLRI
jgi:hypothetical protein